MGVGSEDVLFVGKGPGVVSWYRTGMPAFNLGCDWIGGIGDPDEFELITSLKRGGHSMPSFEDYKIIVLQQVFGKKWRDYILSLRRRGITVLYEVDDYLHGVQFVKKHRHKRSYSPRVLPTFEMCMRVCDGMIVSTEWLGKIYKRFNKNIFLCKNAIESRRYSKFSLPKRNTINIGWAGGEGHYESVMRWLPAVKRLLQENDRLRFITIGLPMANAIRMPRQAIALPFVAIENFPGAMTNFDIAIAPAGRSSFFAAKSDLRFIETGALAIPLVADPFVYKECIDGETALHAETVGEAYDALKKLIENKRLREEIGYNARDYVRTYRSIEREVSQWEKVFVRVYKDKRLLHG